MLKIRNVTNRYIIILICIFILFLTLASVFAVNNFLNELSENKISILAANIDMLLKNNKQLVIFTLTFILLLTSISKANMMGFFLIPVLVIIFYILYSFIFMVFKDSKFAYFVVSKICYFISFPFTYVFFSISFIFSIKEITKSQINAQNKKDILLYIIFALIFLEVIFY